VIYRLTIKEKWLRKLLTGKKEWEVRNYIPKDLKEGDIVEFYDKKRKTSAKFRVKEIKQVPVEEALKYKIGISKAVLFQLAKRDKVYLLKLEKLED